MHTTTDAAYQRAMTAFALSAAVRGAIETPLMASLLDGAPRTSAAHAQHCGLDRRTTHAVLELLAAHALCARDGDTYTASPALLAWRDRTPGGAAQDIAIWLHVPTMLRTGASVGARGEDALGALYKDVTSRLAAMYGPASDALATRVLPMLARAPTRVLDLGCGSGVWGLALAAPSGAHYVGVDRAPVLETLRAFSAQRGLSDRVEGRAGDVLEVPLEDGLYDVVVVANVIRLGGDAFAHGVITRAARACAPDGAVLVVDAFAGGDVDAERSRASYGLHLVARSVEGRVYRTDEVSAWLDALGFTHCTVIESAPPSGALLARRA